MKLATDGVASLSEGGRVVLVLAFGVNCCLTKFKCISALLTSLFFKAELTSSNNTFTVRAKFNLQTLVVVD